MEEEDTFDLYEGLTTAQRQTIFGGCAVDDSDFQHIFLAKCEDFKLQYSEKLFQRFLKHQTKKPFYKIFEMNSCSLGPKAASAVAQVIYAHKNIRAISLSGNNLGNYGAFSMADLILQSRYIISLDLSSNAIGDNGGSAIFQALSKNKSLISLKMGSTSGVSRNSYGQSTLKYVQEMLIANHTLEELDLSMTEINHQTVQLLASGLQYNNCLQVLVLSNNNIQTRGATAVLKAAANSNIRELNFSNNHLKDDISQTFARFLKESKTIEVLDLSGNSLTSRFMSEIAGPLASEESTLIDITMSNNPIGGKGIAAFGPALATNTSLRTLTFVGCKLDSKGFVEFCQEFEKNSGVTKINFGHNPIRDEGASQLAEVIKVHPTLYEINIELCEIGDEAAENLFPALAVSPSVERFCAKNNLIRNGVIIQHAVSDNQKLLYVNVEYNDIDFKVYTEVQRIIKENNKKWKDGQKGRIEEAVILMAAVNDELGDTRAAIKNERQTIAYLIKTLAETRDALKQAELDRDKHLQDLDDEQQDLAKKEEEMLRELREERDQLQGQCNVKESEVSALNNKNDREIANFQSKCKQLKTIEKSITELQETSVTEEQNWKNQLEAAKMKYRDMRSMLEGAYQARKDELDEEARQQQEAERAANEEANPKSPKAKGKGKNKGKGKKGDGGSKLSKAKKGQSESNKESAKSVKPESAEDGDATKENDENQGENKTEKGESKNPTATPSAVASKKNLPEPPENEAPAPANAEGGDQQPAEGGETASVANSEATVESKISIKEPTSPKKGKNPRKGKKKK